jgi:hypothetical protein
MHFLYSVYYELTACKCFEHYLLIFRRRFINNSWYIAFVLCRLTATRFGVELQTWCQPADIIHTQYTIFVYAAPPEDEQVALEACTAC